MVDFDSFFAAEYEPVVRSLTIVFGNRGRAEDAAQVGFEQAFRRWGSVSCLGRPGTWVYVVAVRHGRRDLRRDDRVVASDPAVPNEGHESEVVTAAWVAEAVERLPPRQRAAVVLRHLGGLRISEVADALGIRSGTVKSSLHAAYASLRVDLAEPLESEEVKRNAY